MNVLCLGQETEFHDRLGRSLEGFGHQVEHASSSKHHVVTVSARLRPDLAFVDWILPDGQLGLRWADALRILFPDLRTVLLSRVLTRDLRAAAEQSGVLALLDTHEPDAIPHALEIIFAQLDAPGPGPSVAIPALLLDTEGRIEYLNPAAQQILEAHAPQPLGQPFYELIQGGKPGIISASSESWLEVAPRGDWNRPWVMHSRVLANGGGWLVLLRPHDQPLIENLPPTRLLLRLPDPDALAWPLQGWAAVFDPLRWRRSMIANYLAWVGCGYYATGQFDELQQILAGDPDVCAVVFSAEAEPFEPIAAGRELVWIRFGEEDAQDAADQQSDRAPLHLPNGYLGRCLRCGRLFRLFPLDAEPDWNQYCRCGPRQPGR